MVPGDNCPDGEGGGGEEEEKDQGGHLDQDQDQVSAIALVGVNHEVLFKDPSGGRRIREFILTKIH